MKIAQPLINTVVDAFSGNKQREQKNQKDKKAKSGADSNEQHAVTDEPVEHAIDEFVVNKVSLEKEQSVSPGLRTGRLLTGSEFLELRSVAEKFPKTKR